MSVHFTVKETFNVPQEQAFDALLNLEAASNWMQGLVSIERLDEGPVKEGSQWKETRKMYGKEATELFEVIQIERPNKLVQFCDGKKGSSGKGEFWYTFTVEQAGENKTNLTLNGEIKGLTGLTKLFGKMMAGIFAKAVAKDLAALKNYLES